MKLVRACKTKALTTPYSETPSSRVLFSTRGSSSTPYLGAQERAGASSCAAVRSSPRLQRRPRESVPALMLRLTGLDITRCAVCQQGQLRRTEILAPTPDPPRLVELVNTTS